MKCTLVSTFYIVSSNLIVFQPSENSTEEDKKLNLGNNISKILARVKISDNLSLRLVPFRSQFSSNQSRLSVAILGICELIGSTDGGCDLFERIFVARFSMLSEEDVELPEEDIERREEGIVLTEEESERPEKGWASLRDLGRST